MYILSRAIPVFIALLSTVSHTTAAAEEEISYASLLKLYVAAHHDLLDTETFAWYYYEMVTAPADRNECAELKQDESSTIRFANRVKKQKEAFSAELAQLAGNTDQLLKVPISFNISRYDVEREAFPVNYFRLGYISALNPQRRCSFDNRPTGINYAPKTFSIEPSNSFEVAEIPMSESEAEALIESANLSFWGNGEELIDSANLSFWSNEEELNDSANLSFWNNGEELIDSANLSLWGNGEDLTDSPIFQGNWEELRGIATVRVRPLPFASDKGVKVIIDTLSVDLINPKTGEVFYHLSQEHFPPLAEQKPIPLASDTVPLLTPSDVTLWLVQGDPAILSEKAMLEMTRRQIEREQRNWNIVDSDLATVWRSMSSSNAFHEIHSSKPVFAYDWMTLRQTDPKAAAALIDTFVYADSDWEIYKQDPDYDKRLTAYVETTVFPREAIGIPAVDEFLTMTADFRNRHEVPSAVTLASEHLETMRDFILAVAAAAPRQVRIDIPLQTSFDIRKGMLYLDYQKSPDGVEPLKPVRQARFVEDGDSSEPGMDILLPMIAGRGKVLYQLPGLRYPAENRVSRSQHRGVANNWRGSTQNGHMEYMQLARPQALALDTPIIFRPIEISPDKVVSKVTGRVVLDIVGADVVNVPGGENRRLRPINNGAILAKVVSMEIINEQGELLATLQ